MITAGEEKEADVERREQKKKDWYHQRLTKLLNAPGATRCRAAKYLQYFFQQKSTL